MALIIIEKKDGELTKISQDAISTLSDGKFLMKIVPLREDKTQRDYAAEYFALVDMVKDYTGDEKYFIHNNFKKVSEVKTTTDFTTEEWIKFIDAFKWYYYKQIDLIL